MSGTGSRILIKPCPYRDPEGCNYVAQSASSSDNDHNLSSHVSNIHGQTTKVWYGASQVTVHRDIKTKVISCPCGEFSNKNASAVRKHAGNAHRGRAAPGPRTSVSAMISSVPNQYGSATPARSKGTVTESLVPTLSRRASDTHSDTVKALQKERVNIGGGEYLYPTGPTTVRKAYPLVAMTPLGSLRDAVASRTPQASPTSRASAVSAATTSSSRLPATLALDTKALSKKRALDDPTTASSSKSRRIGDIYPASATVRSPAQQENTSSTPSSALKGGVSGFRVKPRKRGRPSDIVSESPSKVQRVEAAPDVPVSRATLSKPYVEVPPSLRRKGIASVRKSLLATPDEPLPRPAIALPRTRDAIPKVTSSTLVADVASSSYAPSTSSSSTPSSALPSTGNTSTSGTKLPKPTHVFAEQPASSTLSAARALLAGSSRSQPSQQEKPSDSERRRLTEEVKPKCQVCQSTTHKMNPCAMCRMRALAQRQDPPEPTAGPSSSLPPSDPEPVTKPRRRTKKAIEADFREWYSDWTAVYRARQEPAAADQTNYFRVETIRASGGVVYVTPEAFFSALKTTLLRHKLRRAEGDGQVMQFYGAYSIVAQPRIQARARMEKVTKRMCEIGLKIDSNRRLHTRYTYTIEGELKAIDNVFKYPCSCEGTTLPPEVFVQRSHKGRLPDITCAGSCGGTILLRIGDDDALEAYGISGQMIIVDFLH